MRTDNTLTLRLDAFAGSDIEKCARDLCALADRLGVTCELPINDVLLMAFPGGSPQKLVDGYMAELRRGGPHKVADN